MNTSDFKTSINQLQSELTTSREKLHSELERVKSDIKSLQTCLVEKNEQIAALKNQKNELIGFLDQAFAIIDDPSHKKLLDDLCDVRAEVQTLLEAAKCEGLESSEKAQTNGASSAASSKSKVGKAEPDEQAKKFAKEILKGIGAGATK